MGSNKSSVNASLPKILQEVQEKEEATNREYIQAMKNIEQYREEVQALYKNKTASEENLLNALNRNVTTIEKRLVFYRKELQIARSKMENSREATQENPEFATCKSMLEAEQKSAQEHRIKLRGAQAVARSVPQNFRGKVT